MVTGSETGPYGDRLTGAKGRGQFPVGGGWTTNPSKEVVIKTWWQLPKTTLVFWPFWPFFATKRQHLVFCHFLHNTQLRLKILIILRQI